MLQSTALPTFMWTTSSPATSHPLVTPCYLFPMLIYWFILFSLTLSTPHSFLTIPHHYSWIFSCSSLFHHNLIHFLVAPSSHNPFSRGSPLRRSLDSNSWRTSGAQISKISSCLSVLLEPNKAKSHINFSSRSFLWSHPQSYVPIFFFKTCINLV